MINGGSKGMSLNRREFLHVMSIAATAGMLPNTVRAMSSSKVGTPASMDLYQVPMKGTARILHITDTHAQLNPIYFREPNVNLGVGPAFGQLPHVVGTKLINKLGIKENTPLAHAFSSLNFQDASEQYGKVGGFAHVKTLLDILRIQAGGQQNTITMDGGDLWHGFATALWTRGQDMVEASNLLGVDIMTGHWEFTYKEHEVLRNIEKYGNNGLYNEDDGLPFKTYDKILTEELAVAEDTLYRRGNFIGTWDQIIVNSLREEHDTQIAMSAGVRWGTSVLAGETITMERVMDETSMTYGETYKSELTGAQLKDIMEGVCENIFQKDPYLQSGGDMERLGGMDYTCEPNAAFGKRITEMRLDDGTQIEANKSYTVAGWGQVEEVGAGRPVWDVVADHLRRQKANMKLKKVNHPTLKGIKNNPGIENYDGKLLP
jgi:2',3'-cyclic-nucleotide 2'-phosphodiesterase (5'-nucleotidase family)